MSSSSAPGPLAIRSFLLLFLLSAALLGHLLWPFANTLILAFLLAGLASPVYALLRRRLSDFFASLLTCGLLVLLVFVPLVLFVGALSGEALGLYQLGRDAMVGVKLKELVRESALWGQLERLLDGYGLSLDPGAVNDTLSEGVRSLGLFVYQQASAWAANFLGFLLKFLLMVIIVFFLLIDRERLLAFISRLSPLPDEQERVLIRKFEEMAKAILVVNGISGIAQGIMGGAVFALTGLGSPFLWGGMMAAFAFVPIVGTGLIMVPGAAVLFLKGRAASGVAVLAVYTLGAYVLDYVLKAKLVGHQVRMPTLPLLLGILGGLAVYGVLGIIYGPLIITAFLTLADLYQGSYAGWMAGQPAAAGQEGGRKEAPR
ncbi:MAG: AI-2E family transporter [Thermodesulfobacteriota bacterium]